MLVNILKYVKLLHFLNKKPKFKFISFLSAFWDPVTRPSYRLIFQVLLITELLLFLLGSLWVLLESYPCFAFLCLLLPLCTLPNYSKFKSIYDILFVAQSHLHVIKGFLVKHKTMPSHGSNEGQEYPKVPPQFSPKTVFSI